MMAGAGPLPASVSGSVIPPFPVSVIDTGTTLYLLVFTMDVSTVVHIKLLADRYIWNSLEERAA